MKLSLYQNEVVDDLGRFGLKIIQKKGGYRFSLDPVLLASFATVKAGDTVLDLGTGGGVIPLLIAKKANTKSVIGIEIQPELADRAQRSVQMNGLQNRVVIVTGDIRRMRESSFVRSVDVVLANPPYRKSGSGRTAPSEERASARHELAGGLSDFLEAASCFLREKGRFFLVHLPERLSEVLCGMRHVGLEPKRVRFVHPRCDERAKIVLIEGRKGGGEGLVVEPPLFVYDGSGYTPEIMEMYHPASND